MRLIVQTAPTLLRPVSVRRRASFLSLDATASCPASTTVGRRNRRVDQLCDRISGLFWLLPLH